MQIGGLLQISIQSRVLVSSKIVKLALDLLAILAGFV